MRASRLLCSVAALVLAAGLVGGPAPNRLAQEKSPYLRLHAQDLVDWYPWGSEAFEKARKENKPIFLSVGYSTCHWCHVMERESFSNADVAALLNASFVCVIVDREERPELDRVYQTFVQASTGEGGWPLSVWLTPELRPFFGGTYFGPEDRTGQPSFRSVISRIAGLWTSQRDQVIQGSDQMYAALSGDLKAAAAPDTLSIEDLRSRAVAQIIEAFDAEHGGFEQAPKFPQPMTLEFLLDVHATTSDKAQREASLRMALQTLRAIAAGGIHDYVGGGFHRYSVDARWRVPHFEKMLYDQALLSGAYLSAWQVSHDSSMKEAARDTLDYVRSQLTDPAGGFYSAEDADSTPASDSTGPAEGAFYVWTKSEIESVLGPKNAAMFDYGFGVEADGNALPEFAGRNILYRAHTFKECAAKFGIGEDAARATLESALDRLRKARSSRPRPLRDEKVITAWNGLALSAFARACQVLGDPADGVVAERDAAFIRANLYDPGTGRLSHSYIAGRRDDRGFAEDYSFVIQGLLDLYETTFDIQWVKWAVQLQDKQIELFMDPASGGFFANTVDDTSVLLRMKEDSDGSEPSANSVAVRNLARLSAMLDRPDWRDLAGKTARAFGAQLERAPTALPQMLVSLGWLEGSPQQVLIQGEPGTPATARLIGEVWDRFLPRRVLIRIDASSRPYFGASVPIVADLPRDAGDTATAFVCRNFACQLPTSDPAVLAKLLTGEGQIKP